MLASADRVRVTVRFYLVVRWLCKCHPGKLPAKSRYEGYCGRRNVSVHMSSTHVAGLPGWLRGWLAAHFGPLRQRCRPAVPEVDPKWTRNDTLRPTSEPALLRPTSTHFGDIPRGPAQSSVRRLRVTSSQHTKIEHNSQDTFYAAHIFCQCFPSLSLALLVRGHPPHSLGGGREGGMV